MKFDFSIHNFRWATVAFLAAVVLSYSGPALGAGDISTDGRGGLTDQTREVLAISQAAVGTSVANYTFQDNKGREFSISDYKGKPLVVNLIYASCAQSCPPLVMALADAVEIGRDALGDESFNVITVGFDTSFDTPENMASFAKSLGVGDDNWQFLSTDFQSVQGLSDDLGFVFYQSIKGFDHLDQITVIDGNGVVHTQVYGANFPPTLVVEPLKAILFGTTTPYASVEDLVKRVRLFCTIYDPQLGRYRFDYGIFIHLLAGSTFLLAVGTFLIRQLLRFAAEAKAARLDQRQGAHDRSA